MVDGETQTHTHTHSGLQKKRPQKAQRKGAKEEMSHPTSLLGYKCLPAPGTMGS